MSCLFIESRQSSESLCLRDIHKHKVANVKSDDTFCFKEVNDSSCDHLSDGFNEVSVLFQVEVYKLNEEVSRLEQMVR